MQFHLKFKRIRFGFHANNGNLCGIVDMNCRNGLYSNVPFKCYFLRSFLPLHSFYHMADISISQAKANVQIEGRFYNRNEKFAAN